MAELLLSNFDVCGRLQAHKLLLGVSAADAAFRVGFNYLMRLAGSLNGIVLSTQVSV